MEIYFNETFNHGEDKNAKIINKLEKLNRFDYSIENIEELRVLATQNYGLINSKIRKKAWEMLILYDKNSKNEKYLYDEISKF